MTGFVSLNREIETSISDSLDLPLLPIWKQHPVVLRPQVGGGNMLPGSVRNRIGHGRTTLANEQGFHPLRPLWLEVGLE